MSPIRIMLADDHTLVRSGIRLVLESAPNLQVVAEAQSANEVLSLLPVYQPDVLLLDISMPDISGLELISLAREASPHTAIVILSMYKNIEYIARSFQEGAIGYIWKDAPQHELIRAVNQAYLHHHYVPNEISWAEIEEYRNRFSGLDRLTKREREVLRLIAGGLTTNAIAAQLRISPKTVETHRSHIMEKLGIFDIATLTRFAIRYGVITEE